MKKVSALFLTEGKNSPSTCFAVTSLIPYLQKKGVSCTISHRIPEKYALINLPFLNFRILRILLYSLLCYPFSLILRLSLLWKVPAYDIVFLQRDLDENHTTAWLERIFRKFSKCLIFYFDDALWLYRNHSGRSIEDKIQEILRMADWIVVSHNYLADYALRFNSAVKIFPLCIDTHLFIPRSETRSRDLSATEIIVGWSGGPWNYPELIEIAGIMNTIKQRTGAEFLILSGKTPPPEIQDIGVIYLPWQKEKEVEGIQRMDIALCPLKDTPWTRGKFSIKLLQYMACGVPVVCSDAGVNKEIIINGVTGFVVVNEQEWVSSLLTLIYNKEKRMQMGIMGRQRAVEHYSTEKGGFQLAELFIHIKTLKSDSFIHKKSSK